MATKVHEIEGKILWANNLFVADNYAGNSYYKANLVVDLDNYDKFRLSGVRTKVRKDEDGNPLILLKRNAKPSIGNDGKEFAGGMPAVFDEAGNPWDREKLIGNNSIVRANYITYDTDTGKGHRLESIVVMKHIPYVNQEAREQAEEPSAVEVKKPNVKVPF